MPENILEVRHLSKFFVNNPALFDISFEISEGDITVIVGPNGSGKTTLLKLMTGLMAPSHGELFYKSRPMRRQIRTFRSKIGLLPDHPLLYQQLTLSENFKLLGRIYDIPREQMNESLRRFRLDNHTELKTFELSKGMIQRAMVALFSALSPELLFLDEPFTGLDTNGQELVLAYLKQRHARKQTTILITHTLSPIDQTWTQLLVLKGGTLLSLQRQQDFEQRISAICAKLAL